MAGNNKRASTCDAAEFLVITRSPVKTFSKIRTLLKQKLQIQLNLDFSLIRPKRERNV